MHTTQPRACSCVEVPSCAAQVANLSESSRCRVWRIFRWLLTYAGLSTCSPFSNGSRGRGRLYLSRYSPLTQVSHYALLRRAGRGVGWGQQAPQDVQRSGAQVDHRTGHKWYPVFPSSSSPLLCGHSPLPWQAELANEGHASPEAPQTAPAKPSLIPQGTQLFVRYSPK